MSTRRPPVGEMIDRHVLGALDELHTWLPAVVTRYDASLQQVDVKPLVKHAFYDASGKRNLEALGVVTNVPVRFMSAGGFTLSCPISDGQTKIKADPADAVGVVQPATLGCLFFSESSLDRWLSGTGAEVDPESDERHTENSGVFMPGLNPFGAPLSGVFADRAALGYLSGGALLQVFKDMLVVAKSGEEGGANFVALANLVLAELNAIKTAWSGHTHTIPALAGTIDVAHSTCSIPAPGNTGAAAAYNPGSVAATELKAK